MTDGRLARHGIGRGAGRHGPPHRGGGGFALHRIAADGAFLPFALAVRVERQVVAPNLPVGVGLGVEEQIAAHWRALGEVKATLRAAVVAVNVRLPESGRDAIELTVEHREGIALGVVFPYEKKADGGYRLLTPSAHPQTRRIWAD